MREFQNIMLEIWLSCVWSKRIMRACHKVAGKENFNWCKDDESKQIPRFHVPFLS